MFFQPLKTSKWKLAAVAKCFVFWFGCFFKLSPFTEVPDPQHTFPSPGACVAAVLGYAALKGSRHYPSPINQTVPNIPYLTALSNGTDTADESHKQYTATKFALKTALQLFREAYNQQYLVVGVYFLCLH